MAVDNEIKQAIARDKERCRDMMKRVPASVNRGSYQTAVNYKELVKKATKLVAQEHPNYQTLQKVTNELSQFY